MKAYLKVNKAAANKWHQWHWSCAEDRIMVVRKEWVIPKDVIVQSAVLYDPHSVCYRIWTRVYKKEAYKKDPLSDGYVGDKVLIFEHDEPYTEYPSEVLRAKVMLL